MIPKKPENSFWSDEQWAAIYESGQDILVNAGAGSGKTAVLTERIIRILKDGIGLDRLIVLTFTKAAAGEMKERLRKKLKKEIESGYDLQDALDYLDQASVQTFDSFALELVRRYHYLLGVNRSIGIGDNVLFSLRKKEIIDQVFNSFYEEEDADFLNLVALFSIKNDNNLQKFINDVDRKLDLIPDKQAYLDSYLDKYYQPDFIRNRINEYEELLALEKERIKKRLERLKEEVMDEDLIVHVLNCEEVLSDLLSSKTYLEYRENVEVRLPNIPKNADEDEKALVSQEKDEIKRVIKRLQEYLEYEGEEEMFGSVLKTKPYVAAFIKVLKRVGEEFYKYKKKYNIYEFQDIAKMAIKLLKENDEAREYLKEHTYEILIDEYQDTNDLQEILIKLIKKNNLYMVGDIKQSIYRFRNANPEIFKEKYRLYKEEKVGLAIDLSRNFRSRQEVLEDINLIFSQIMCPKLGGVDYGAGQELLFGNKNYSKNAPEDYQLRILSYDYQNEELSNHEIEAFLIGKDILKMLEKHKIYDKDQDLIRPVRYNDFTILASEKRQFDLYKKIFEYLGIPLVIHKDESFIQSQEIYVLKNILRAIYSLNNFEYFKNNFQDSVVSILRSFLVEGSDGEIIKLFTGNFLEGLKCRFPEVYSKLVYLSSQARKSTLSEIVWEIFQVFNFYSNLLKIGNLEEIEEKLNFLLQKFKEFDGLGYRLNDSINYLEEIMIEKMDIEFSLPHAFNNEAVQMMSVHKSKGLEFPICYYPELDCRFKFNEVYDRVVFDQKYGIIFPVFNEGLQDIFYKKLLKQKYQIEEISERIRVLYVALTRAKEQLIVVAPKFTESFRSKTKLLNLIDRLNYKSFFDVFSSVSASINQSIEQVSPFGLSKDYEKGKDISPVNFEKGRPLIIKPVSLKKQKIESRTASSKTFGLLNKNQIENIKFGNLLHEILEFLDFKEDVQKQLKELDLPIVFKERIISLFLQPLFKKDILNTYHEYPFINGDINGVIDLIIETKEELIIIDYKLSDLSKPEYIGQLEIYRNYLETISEKSVQAYLYSLLKGELKEVF
mgnify:CR=1 FL=1